MPDIAMCKNTECPLRHTCYRSPASGTEPNPYRQSYGSYSPRWVGDSDHGDESGWVCDHYWPTKEGEEQVWG